MINRFVDTLDRIWCSDTQMSASLLYELTSNKKSALKLSHLRLNTTLCVFLELFGLFLMTLGFFSSNYLVLLIVGVFLKIIGSLGSALFLNRSGVFLSLELQECLKYLKMSGREIHSFLANKGCSESEINSIAVLPNEIYQSELNSYQRAKLINLGSPIICAIALFISGEIATAIVIILLGLMSFPIGEMFFKEYVFRTESEMRLGRSAHLINYIRRVYRDHILLTVKVNFLSQIPYALLVLRFVWDGSGLIASFFGLSQGLVGLTGTLAFQRSRMTALRTTETARHLIAAITSSDLIITPKRLLEHSQDSDHFIASSIKKISDGVAFQNFAAKTCGNIKTLPALDCLIKSGSVTILRAPSGQGKSTFLLATMHLLEHKGEIYFIKDYRLTNIHTFTKNELEKAIYFFREETVEKSARLIDLFKPIIAIQLSDYLAENKRLFGDELIDLAWLASDNLIEQEIVKMTTNHPTVLPKNMISFLIEMREKRSEKVKEMLFFSGGNLSSPNMIPERFFETLSSGEKRRVITTLAFETAKNTKGIKLVILDEPFTHLDAQSIQKQLETILHMQKILSPPSILIISHHFTEEITSFLDAVQIHNF